MRTDHVVLLTLAVGLATGACSGTSDDADTAAGGGSGASGGSAAGSTSMAGSAGTAGSTGAAGSAGTAGSTGAAGSAGQGGSGTAGKLGAPCGSGCNGTFCMGTHNPPQCLESDLAQPCVGTSAGMYCSRSCTSDDQCRSTLTPMRCLVQCANYPETAGICWATSEADFLQQQVCS